MQKKLKPIPQFKSENEEAQFWLSHESSDYIDWSKGVNAVFPNLKPSSKTVTIRFPQSLLDDLKVIANKKDVPYQSLVKIYLDQKVKEEQRSLVDKRK